MYTDTAGRQELSRLSTQMRNLVDGVETRGGRVMNSSEREKWNRLKAAYEREEARVLASEKRRRSLNEPRAAAGARISDLGDIEELRDVFRLSPAQKRAREREHDPRSRAFSAYLRHGYGSLDQDQQRLLRAPDPEFTARASAGGFRNAQSGVVGSQGGFIIPEGFSYELEQAMLWFGGIDGVVGEFDTESGNPMPWPTVNDTMNKGRIIGQNVQISETDFVFDQVTFNSFIGSSDIVLIPIALVEDSAFDLDALTAQLLGTRLGRLLNWKGTVGTGTAEPTGIVTAAVAAGNILTLSTGNTASIAYANLVPMQHAVDPAYRNNPGTRWMFADAMLKLLKLLVDGNNRPLWQPGLSASFQEGAGVDITVSKPKILDTPYVINQDMATPAANAYSLLYGDMSKFKRRKIQPGITVMRLVERYADYLQVGYQAYMRFDTNLIDAGTNPIAVMQQSAS
jgi:HK97 family phage major capsid protein